LFAYIHFFSAFGPFGIPTLTQHTRLKPIALPVWLAASSCWKRYSLTSYGLNPRVKVNG